MGEARGVFAVREKKNLPHTNTTNFFFSSLSSLFRSPVHTQKTQLLSTRSQNTNKHKKTKNHTTRDTQKTKTKTNPTHSLIVQHCNVRIRHSLGLHPHRGLRLRVVPVLGTRCAVSALHPRPLRRLWGRDPHSRVCVRVHFC